MYYNRRGHARSVPAGPAAGRGGALLLLLLGCALGFLLSGCVALGTRAPARTTVETKTTVVPARIISNFFLVEARQADGLTYRFLVDTGSSVTLVSPALAKALRVKPPKGPAPTVRVRSANGGEVALESLTLRTLRVGDTVFERVPALVTEFTDLSGHLGLTIDGVMGFPVFRDTLLTLDYPGSRLVIAPYPAVPPPVLKQSARVSTIAFNNERNSPLIPIQMGNESFIVLIDSGSDGSLTLNPVGLHPRFAYGPRVGTLVASLAGDRRQLVGRLAQNILIGSQVLDQPIVDLTDELSSLGGEVLRNFSLTFDQRRNQVTFARDVDGPVRLTPRRSSGLSFGRSPVYWRVLAVVPEAPAAQLNLQPGDLVVRINGEPVAQWDYERYAQLVKTAAKITCTVLAGTREYDVEVPVFELVP
ncbi:MAG: aspartyl protease family protein [Opitutae bacterium]|nr:aspartyl protease family protein [Opitutae bacterium]